MCMGLAIYIFPIGAVRPTAMRIDQHNMHILYYKLHIKPEPNLSPQVIQKKVPKHNHVMQHNFGAPQQLTDTDCPE